MCQETSNVVVAEAESQDSGNLLDFVALRTLVESRGGHIQIFAYEGGTRNIGIHALSSIRCFYCGQYIFRGRGKRKLTVSDPQAKTLSCHCSNCSSRKTAPVAPENDGQEETATTTTETDAPVVCMTDSSVSGMQTLSMSFGGTSLVGTSTKTQSGRKHLRREKVGGESNVRRGHNRRCQRCRSFAGGR